MTTTANRNKRSIVLDLKTTSDARAGASRCASARTWSSRTSSLGRSPASGSATSRSARRNPGVIHCEISGFGERGGARHARLRPDRAGGRRADEHHVGRRRRRPRRASRISTWSPPSTPRSAVLAALYARRATGRGQRVTIDLLSADLAVLANQSTGWLADREVPLRLGNDHPSIEPFATYAAADGDLMLGAGNDGQFRRLAEAIGTPELAVDPPVRDQRGAGWQPRRAEAAARGAAANANAGRNGATSSSTWACPRGRCRRSTRRSHSPPSSDST